VTGYGKCLNPRCARKVTPGVAYCCEPCWDEAEAPAPHEVAHSEFCEAASAREIVI
jgi:hypothetical protein